MSFHDYIKIKGYAEDIPENVDPATFEIFQGLGAELLAQQTVDPGTGLVPVVPATPIPEALWTGQNTLIQGEIEFCNQLSDLWKKQQRELPSNADSISAWIEDLISTRIGLLAGSAVAGFTGVPVLGVVTSLLIQTFVGVVIEKIHDFFIQGIGLCDGIKGDDTTLLTLEQGLENYALRNEALRLHTAQLKNAIDLIGTMGNLLDKTVSSGDTTGIIKAIETLQYNDEMLDFGDAHLHLRGRIIGD